MQKPLHLIEEKYIKRKKYYETISSLKEAHQFEFNCKNISGKDSYSEENFQEKEDFIYCKTYEVNVNGSAFSSVKRRINCSYEDTIVGWSIEDLWNDGTNGTWTLEENPLLKKKINCSFNSQFFRGMHFRVKVYLIKYPE